MDKMKSMVPKKMNPCYSYGGLSSQKSISCEPSIGSFLRKNKYASTHMDHLHAS
jgi:hypothetical protein